MMTNELCLQWVPYIPGTMAQNVLLLVHRTCRETHEGVGTYCMPIQEREIGVASIPCETSRGSQVEPKFLLHNIPNTIVNKIANRVHQFSFTRCKLFFLKFIMINSLRE